MDIENKEPTIVEVRRFIFDQMVKLSKGKISIQEGVTQAKLAHQVMDAYKTQVRMLEVVGVDSLKSKDIKELTASMDGSNVQILQ